MGPDGNEKFKTLLLSQLYVFVRKLFLNIPCDTPHKSLFADSNFEISNFKVKERLKFLLTWDPMLITMIHGSTIFKTLLLLQL